MIMIDVHCKNCGLHVQIADSLAGKKGKCPKCGNVLTIGQPAPETTRKAPGESAAPQPEAAPVSTLPGTAAAAESKSPPAAGREPIPFDSLGEDEPTAHVVMPNKTRLGDNPAGHDAAASESGISRKTGLAAGIHHGDGSDVHVPRHLDVMSHYVIVGHKDLIARWQSDGRGWQVRLKDGFARATTCASNIPEVGKFLMIEIGVERRDDGIHLRNITPYRLQERHALTKLVQGDDHILTAIVGIGQLNQQQRTHVRVIVHQKFLPHIWPELDELMPEAEHAG
jgi:hypothetical protein